MGCIPQRNRRQGKKLAQVARIHARGQLHIPGSSHAIEVEFDEALAAFGFAQDGDSDGATDGICYLWPCNVKAFRIWQCLQTQWVESAVGVRTGLDYGAVAAYLRDVLCIKPKARASLFARIQAMEFACLDAWNQSRAS